MVPVPVTLAAVATELPALIGYAQRHDWKLDWDPVDLSIRADSKHPANSEPLRLHVALDGYPALPPIWRFVEPGQVGVVLGKFPSAGSLPGGAGSIFHGSRLICAPFNRFAYSDHGGPHSDWHGPAQWREVRGHVRAVTLTDMLAVICAHLHYSPGWIQ
jgi:hypothetical protein